MKQPNPFLEGRTLTTNALFNPGVENYGPLDNPNNLHKFSRAKST